MDEAMVNRAANMPTFGRPLGMHGVQVVLVDLKGDVKVEIPLLLEIERRIRIVKEGHE